MSSPSAPPARNPPAATPAPLQTSELAEYLLELSGALLSYGCPTHRVESVIRVIAEREGHEADAFAVPTGLWMSLRAQGSAEPAVRMVRVKEWSADLERLALVDEIFNDVIDRRATLQEARKRLHAVETRKSSYPTWLAWLATAGAAASASVFFDAGPREIAFAGLGGLCVGALRTLVGKNLQLRLLEDFLGGLVAAIVAWAATLFDPRLSREVLVLSIVILLVPGMAITTGLAELAYRNLVSGASKLMEAMIVLLSIVFGIASLVVIERFFHVRALPPVPRHDASLAWELTAIVLTSLCFGVMFRVPRKLLFTAILSGGIGWIVSAIGSRHLPQSVAAFAAALSVCLFANAAARISERPAQVFLLPGLVLLVPGSFGFLSLESFLRGELLGGAEKGFEMFLIAAALVIGLLVANVVLPARKAL